MGAYSDRIIADGASNYWRLGETAGLTAVDVVGGKNGTISGGVTLAQPGALVDGDKAMTFDGTTGKIQTVSMALPLISTIEVWLKGNDNAPNRPIVQFDGQNPILYLINKTVSIYDIGGGGGQSSALPDGRWNHVVVAFDAVGTKFYINGVLNLAAPYPRTTSTASLMSIGYSVDNATYWLGLLDEIAIYPRALSAAEIKAHYDLRPAPFAPSSYQYRVIQDGASNYWRLGELSGTVAVDAIGGANGTISGGVTLAQPGAVGGDRAMRFDGSTGVVTAANALNCGPATQSFSIELWSNGAYNLSPAGLVNKGDIAFNGAQTGWMLNLQAAGIWQFARNSGVAGSPPRLQFSTPLVPNVWSHIVVTYDATTKVAAAYVNGVANGAITLVSPGIEAYTDTQLVKIGSCGYGAIAAMIDDVAIYPHALTAPEIAAHYTAGLASRAAAAGSLVLGDAALLLSGSPQIAAALSAD